MQLYSPVIKDVILKIHTAWSDIPYSRVCVSTDVVLIEQFLKGTNINCTHGSMHNNSIKRQHRQIPVTLALFSLCVQN